MLVLVAAYYRPNISRVLLFWAAFILTRPLGATVGDYLDKAIAQGGLNVSRPLASIVLAVFIVACIALLPQRGMHCAASAARGRSPENGEPMKPRSTICARGVAPRSMPTLRRSRQAPAIAVAAPAKSPPPLTNSDGHADGACDLATVAARRWLPRGRDDGSPARVPRRHCP